jgi:Fuc2NAc and GlcNAc transferase
VSALALTLAAAALVLTVLLTGWVRARALRSGILDVPNERSSHSTATPRGGGAAIVLVVSCGSLILELLGALPHGLFAALTGGGLAVAVVGFLDDRRAVPAAVRLAVHVCAASWALACLGGLPPLRFGSAVIGLGWPGDVLAVCAIVWVLNLFNFMDGIDGIAASEAVFVSVAGSALGLLAGPGDAVSALALLLGAACAGFLWWNWPPARIFLGDVGSGYLGFGLALLTLAAARSNPVAVWVWLILGGAFLADATLTLVRRALRGERLHQAHRSHAYQRLARRWSSHRRATLTFAAVNVVWLLPCAAIAARRPSLGAWIALAALAPLFALAYAAGAGEREWGGAAARAGELPGRGPRN